MASGESSGVTIGDQMSFDQQEAKQIAAAQVTYLKRSRISNSFYRYLTILIVISELIQKERNGMLRY